MATVFLNQSVGVADGEPVWSAKNGATRTHLKLIDSGAIRETETKFKCSIGTLNKGNHSFIFLNPPKANDNRVLGVFLNSSYSFKLVEGKELFRADSEGGYGNSCSSFGVYEVGALLKVHTYKFRKSPSYYRLTESGWLEVPDYEIESGEQAEL